MYVPTHSYPIRPVRLASLLAVVGLCCSVASARAVSADKAPAPKHSKASSASAVAAPVRLAYQLKPGDSYRYNVTALFTGHFPPFSQPGSPPVNLQAKLTYVANVKKQDAAGSQVEFVVEAAEISLLEKMPKPNEKVDPDSETPFSLPLSQIQKTLNVTATLRPDGSVANVTGGDTSPVKIDLGFDLRKLFLLLMPVTFPNGPIQLNQPWTFDDGVLGHKPGRIAYTGRLTTIAPKPGKVAYNITEFGQSLVSDQRDKDGKPTDKPADVVMGIHGKVTFNGTLTFVTSDSKARGGADNMRRGRITEGRLLLNAQLDQKRAKPDPNLPDSPLESKIDVKGRLFVQAQPASQQPAANSTGASPSEPAGSGKDTNGK